MPNDPAMPTVAPPSVHLNRPAEPASIGAERDYRQQAVGRPASITGNRFDTNVYDHTHFEDDTHEVEASDINLATIATPNLKLLRARLDIEIDKRRTTDVSAAKRMIERICVDRGLSLNDIIPGMQPRAVTDPQTSADESTLENGKKALKSGPGRPPLKANSKASAKGADKIADTTQAKATKSSKKRIRFRDPKHKENTWTGRGRRPTWLVNELSKGRKLEDFATA
jgi:hypothetical protein